MIIPGRSEKTRAISLGMLYDYTPCRSLRFKDKNNKNRDVSYCTFGLGVQRVLYAFLDSNRDQDGFHLGEMAPFGVSIMPLNKNFLERSLEVYGVLRGDRLLDDRKNKNLAEKVAFSDYLGIPLKIIVDAEGYVLKNRSEREIRNFKTLEELVNSLRSSKKDEN